jgi:hypothetical protein
MLCALCCGRAGDSFLSCRNSAERAVPNGQQAKCHDERSFTFAQIALLVAYAGGMAGGQLLFKMAALRGAADGPLGERLTAMMLNGFFAAAVLMPH